MTGIGGDCFALIGTPDGKVTGLNGSGRAPLAADADWLQRSRLSEIAKLSVHAVTVPGAIDAWDQLLRRHGTIDLGQALEPAIRLAEEGVPVTPRVAHDWPEHVEDLKSSEGGRHFLKDGRAPRAGEVMRYPALARTLRQIAREGRDFFYLGGVAEEIVTVLKARGGLLTCADLERHKSDWVKPISTRFAGRDIHEIPPNGQGLTALIALNVLSHCGLRRHGARSAERYHLMIEAMKLAWVYRNRHIGDPAFADIPVEDLLSERLAQKLAGLIDMNRATDVSVVLPRSGTVYLTVVDRNRLAVSFINSVYDGFGSCIVLPDAGFALQNRGSCFVTTPGHPNCIGPGKRPLHTIIPAMACLDGEVEMSFGVKGGDYQPMGHVMVAANRYVYGMDAQEAIDMARVFPSGGEVVYESPVSAEVLDGLARRGHRLKLSPEPLGGGQAIVIDRENGVLIGGSEPRKDGLALGY
jgi:gamma-glutamyltranspeptidase/glutathione hydrolase